MDLLTVMGKEPLAEHSYSEEGSFCDEINHEVEIDEIHYSAYYEFKYVVSGSGVLVESGDGYHTPFQTDIVNENEEVELVSVSIDGKEITLTEREENDLTEYIRENIQINLT